MPPSGCGCYVGICDIITLRELARARAAVATHLPNRKIDVRTADCALGTSFAVTPCAQSVSRAAVRGVVERRARPADPLRAAAGGIRLPLSGEVPPAQVAGPAVCDGLHGRAAGHAGRAHH